jgi:hypothetical protein
MSKLLVMLLGFVLAIPVCGATQQTSDSADPGFARYPVEVIW